MPKEEYQSLEKFMPNYSQFLEEVWGMFLEYCSKNNVGLGPSSASIIAAAFMIHVDKITLDLSGQEVCDKWRNEIDKMLKLHREWNDAETNKNRHN